MYIKFKWDGVRSLNSRRGFVLIESLTALMISTLIIFLLTICVNEQFKLLNDWEQRVNAHKVILLNLKDPQVKNPLVIENKRYYFQKNNETYQVRVNNDVYEIKVKS